MDFTSLSTEELVWLGIGFFGQALFFSRWLLQWFVSEKKAESQIPVSFWYISLAGSVIVLAYAIHKIDPVFIAGQSVGTVVYIRNLILIHRVKGRVKSG
jgi:lipid-A-disaccharide synthase-like uncharacterized protein